MSCFSATKGSSLQWRGITAEMVQIVCTSKFCFKCGTACLSYAFLKEFLVIFLPEFKALFKALQKLTTCHTKLIAVMLCDEHGNVVSQINGFEKKTLKIISSKKPQ